MKTNRLVAAVAIAAAVPLTLTACSSSAMVRVPHKPDRR